MKTSESQFSVTPAEEIEDVTSEAPLLSYGASSVSMPNHTSKSANGSIITMTLKNNHLIVETEERGGVVTDGSTKTTTTKFTTSASPHENNVFVVEVQQGGAPRTSDCFSNNSELYPKFSSSAVSSQEDMDEEDGIRRSSSQRAQVHRPPDIDVDEVSDEDDLEDIDDIDEDEEESTEKLGTRNEEDTHGGSTNTGLSQSDLSISSSGSNNPSYRYGNQLGYEGGHFGYPQYAGYGSSDDKVARTASSSGGNKAPIIRRYPPAPTFMKRASSVNEASERPPVINPGRERYSIDVTPISQRLLSDIQAIERRRIQLEDDRIQEEQRQLGNGTVKIDNVAPLAVANGDSTSSSVEEEPSKNEEAEDENKDEGASLQRTGSLPSKLKKEANTSEDISNDIIPKPETEKEKASIEINEEKGDCDGVSKKRASLPIITPELYTHIKQTTKSLILDKTSRPGLSPKFEKFRNENSPLDETDKDETQQVSDTTPTKSQEYENEAFVSSDHITS
ncbi:hypothetical protein L9F63_022861 [Diploptera punctata]|uniref:Uncharacterized protein n=1 Tax=Diploptera punctata TaxID=6984 RepID=A0AAD8EAD8_DIPPU|nr:hypothetical protein L9F63_022861 [Diploptera punctata]